jgi:6-pyruvoyltetrahydropterin/6-carboxytetrahydropterin synthase
VRFSINPFLAKDDEGFNSYASKPTSEGLAIFLEIGVELVGRTEPATGFVVNVIDIDETVRKYVVPIFAERIKKSFRQYKYIGLSDMTELLKSAWRQLADKFGEAKLKELSLALNPFRKIAIDCEDSKMFYFSEKFEFAATHRLWNDNFSDKRNFEVFGKCANPAGHGHNYIVEVTIKAPLDKELCIGDIERIIDGELISLLDHKNLNAEIAEFGKINPTVENIAVFAWDKLSGRFGSAVLHCVTVRETDRTSCSYYGGKKDL